MNGLGRIYPALLGDMRDADQRRRADAWHRLHQRPDAPPLPRIEPTARSWRRQLGAWPLIGRWLVRDA